MQERLVTFLNKEIQPKKTDRMLLAVSGGADSMVMLRLFYALQFDCIVAHVNYGLRGAESDADSHFVQDTSDRFNMLCCVKSFDTKAIAAAEKKGIQEVARDLRYAWFEELCLEFDCDFIATAHNSTDNVETVIMNQLRGTGLRGFAGIPVVRGNIIRPMLCFTGDEIREYAEENNIQYRNDSSNETDNYLRNKVRHHVVPALKEVEKEVESRFEQNSSEVREWMQLLDYLTDKVASKLTKTDFKDDFKIPISKLRSYPQPHLILYAILNKHGFTVDNCIEILKHRKSGNSYFSNSHQVVVHKKHWIVSVIQNQTLEAIQITKEGSYVFGDYEISLMNEPVDTIDYKARDIMYFDAFELSLPLEVRTWQEGDYIRPLKMSGKKLLSDLFNEAQIPVHRRTRVPVFVKDEEIICVGNLRQSDSYKVNKNTLMVWRLEVYLLEK